MASKVKITYIDGATDVAEIRPRSLVQYEKRFRQKFESSVTAVMWTAWHALVGDGGGEGFEQWVDRVDEIDQNPDGDDELDPTEPSSGE